MLQPFFTPSHAGREAELRCGQAGLNREKAQAWLAHSSKKQTPFIILKSSLIEKLKL
jgi:hypothetical protein